MLWPLIPEYMPRSIGRYMGEVSKKVKVRMRLSDPVLIRGNYLYLLSNYKGII